MPIPLARLPLLITPFFALLTFALNAQDDDREAFFKAYAHAGVNVAQIDGDGPHGFRFFGPRAGIGTYFFFHKRLLSLGLEMNYTQRGSRGRDYVFTGIENALDFRQTTNYVETPILFRIHDKRKAHFQLGLTPAFLISDKISYRWLFPNDPPLPACLTSEFERFDLSVLGGLFINVTPQIGIGGSFNYSLRSIRPSCGRPDTVVKGQYHRIVSVSAFYSFNVSNSP